MRFEFSAGGIIYRKTSVGKIEFALVLDSYDKWTFPKGHIEKREKPEQAALREVSEEIGISDLKIIKLLDKIDYWFRLKGDLIHKYVYFYLIEAPENAKLKHQVKELQDAKWFSQDEALKIIGYKKDEVPLLKKAIADLVIRQGSD